MNWSTFFTYILQAIIVGILLFVGSAVCFGVLENIRKNRRD